MPLSSNWTGNTGLFSNNSAGAITAATMRAFAKDINDTAIPIEFASVTVTGSISVTNVSAGSAYAWFENLSAGAAIASSSGLVGNLVGGGGDDLEVTFTMPEGISTNYGAAVFASISSDSTPPSIPYVESGVALKSGTIIVPVLGVGVGVGGDPLGVLPLSTPQVGDGSTTVFYLGGGTSGAIGTSATFRVGFFIKNASSDLFQGAPATSSLNPMDLSFQIAISPRLPIS